MTRRRTALLGLVLAAAVGAGGCLPWNVGVFEADWDRSPEAQIASATYCCGFVPYLYVLNVLPEAQIWGDGRILWTTSDEDGRRTVWAGRLFPDELQALFARVWRDGFFRWKALYNDPLIVDASPQCVRVALQHASQEVCEVVRGAPAAFHALYAHLASGAGAEGAPFVPERGWLIAHPVLFEVPPDEGEVFMDWSADALGLSLAEAADGLWVTGDALQAAWDVVNTRPWANLVRETAPDGTLHYYQLSVQIPDVSQNASNLPAD